MSLDARTLQDLAFVQERLFRDMRNAHNAVQHSERAMDTHLFALALISATADFCLDNLEPPAKAEQAIPMLTGLFRQELEKLARQRRAAVSSEAR